MGKLELPMTRYELTRLEGLLTQLLEQAHEDAGATAHQLDAIIDARGLAHAYRQALPKVDAFTARRAKLQAITARRAKLQAAAAEEWAERIKRLAELGGTEGLEAPSRLTPMHGPQSGDRRNR